MAVTALEREVLKLWRQLPYARFGACAICGRRRGGDDRPLLVRGRSPSVLVCLGCFDQRGCRAPRRRRREAIA